MTRPLLFALLLLPPQEKSWKEENFAGDPPKEILVSRAGRIELVGILGSRQLHHGRYVTAVAYTPDGKTALSASEDGTLKAWNAADGREIGSWQAHEGGSSPGGVKAMAVRPDGASVLTCGGDGFLKLWDLATRQSRTVFSDMSSRPGASAFSPDGKSFLTGHVDGVLRLWDSAKGTKLGEWKISRTEIGPVAFSPDGKSALLADGEGILRHWELPSGNAIAEWKPGRISAIAWLPDGKSALFSDRRDRMVLWDPAAGKELASARHGHGSAWSIALSSDVKQALCAHERGLKLWQLGGLKQIRSFEGHGGRITSAALHPDGKSAVSGAGDGTVRFWNVATGNALMVRKGHQAPVTGVDLSPDEQTLFSVSEDGTIRKWEIATGKERAMWKTQKDVRGLAVAFAPDGKTAIGGLPISRWDAGKGEAVATWKDASGPTRIAFSPDGKRVAIASGSTLELYEVSTGKKRRHWMSGGNAVYALAYHPDGKSVLSVSFDRNFKLWSPDADLEVMTWKGHTADATAVAISADGKWILSGGMDRKVRLWDWSERKELATWDGHAAPVLWVAFGPDGTALSLGEDRALRLWDIAGGREIDSIVVNGGATCMAVRGRAVAIGNRDTSVTIYRIK